MSIIGPNDGSLRVSDWFGGIFDAFARSRPIELGVLDVEPDV